MRIWFDTESIQFLGATMLIQYARENDRDNIILHDIFDRPVIDTLELIQELVHKDTTLVGYNLQHDAYHLSRTFNCLKNLSQHGSPPDPYEYAQIEHVTKNDLCVLPHKCVDLMIAGRRNKLQSTMKQHPIIIRRIPRSLSGILIEHLNKIEIPSIYFAKSKKGKHWVIKNIDAETGEQLANTDKRPCDPNLVDLVLNFAPSAKLKDICKHILGFKDTEEYTSSRKYKEMGWNPRNGEWIEVFAEHYSTWKLVQKQREYARRDIIYTQAIDEWLGYPEPCRDSHLAAFIGNTYWSGFGLDMKEVTRQESRLKNSIKRRERRIPINIRSPKQVLPWLQEVCHPIEKLVVTSSDKETLKALESSANKKLRLRAIMIKELRAKKYEYDILKRLKKAGRLYVTFTVAGTRTNRSSGGDSINKTKSINPQGIKKGEMRRCINFKDKDYVVSGGDFSGFEVAIYTAVYKDPKLLQELQSGKKIHALWGSFLYNLSYEDVLATSEIKATEEDGFYSRAKNSFFAMLYGAQVDKVAEITWLTVEEVQIAFNNFLNTYTKVKESQEQNKTDYSCIKQLQAGGTVQWIEPKKYKESFLGFRRDFSFEFSVIKQIFEIAAHLPKEIIERGKSIGVLRRDRMQSGSGAIRSALFGACGNLMGKVQRIAGNFEIQSPGGEITKELQYEISLLQPKGIAKYQVKTFNMHDEVNVMHAAELSDVIKNIVNNFVNRYKSYVPLLKIDWKQDMDSWADKSFLLVKEVKCHSEH